MSYISRSKPLSKLGSLAAVALLLPNIALAGGKATMTTSAQPIQIEGQIIDEEPTTLTITWQDVSTVRMDFGDPSNYFIMRDGNAYLISQEAGEIQVMDMASMRGMIQAMSDMGEKKENPFGSIESVKATSAKETIAGIKGRVYQMTWTDPDGSNKTDDLVLTSDSLVVEMTEAYLGSMSAMIGDQYTRTYQDALPDNERGLLQMGDQFYVESIQHANPPASTFELPAQPINLQDLFSGIGK